MIGSDFTGAARADEYNKALGYYQQAVAIDPDNRLLHEYMGKLYLLMRDQPLADSELKTLEKLCPSGCAERDTLSNVMLAYMASTPPSRAPSPATPPPAK
jgi:tetratricopeptide (TPR) repeat protein